MDQLDGSKIRVILGSCFQKWSWIRWILKMSFLDNLFHPHLTFLCILTNVSNPSTCWLICVISILLVLCTYIYICIQIFISFIYLHNIYIYIYLFISFICLDNIYIHIYTYLYDLYPRKVSEELGNSKVFVFFQTRGLQPDAATSPPELHAGLSGGWNNWGVFPLGERMEKVLLQLYLVGLVWDNDG